MKAKLYISF